MYINCKNRISNTISFSLPSSKESRFNLQSSLHHILNIIVIIQDFAVRNS